jgi:ribosomal protein S4
MKKKRKLIKKERMKLQMIKNREKPQKAEKNLKKVTIVMPQYEKLIKNIERILIKRRPFSSKSMNIVFQRLDFTIQKGLATQLIVCLPFIHV